MATLVLLAPLFSHLPTAVLGAVIIDAVVFGMIDLSELRRLHRVARFDFWVAVAAILGVLSVGVLAGVVVGVVLSLGWLVYVATRPPMPVLGRDPDGPNVFRDLNDSPHLETTPGVVVLRFDGGLFFATAEALEDRARRLVQDGGMRTLVLNMEAVAFIDSQGARKLSELHAYVASEGVSLRLARLKPGVEQVLVADGFIELAGRDHVHPTIGLALEAETARRRVAGN